MPLLKIKKTENDRIRRIEELERRIKKIEGPSYVTEFEKKPPIKEILKPKEELEKEEKKPPIKEILKPKEELEEAEKEFLDEVRTTLKEAAEKGTIKIDTTVKDIMTTDVKTVEPNDDLRKVLTILSEYKITGVPVVSDNKIVGIVSQSDIIKIMDERDILDPQRDVVQLSELERLKVNDIMTKNPILINQKEKITDASDLMSKHDVERLPVIDDKNNMVGIITREDIIRGMANEFFVKSIQAGGGIIETHIDKLINIVENKGSVTITVLSYELGISSEKIEEWAKILEERGMIEIEYPPIGPIKLRMKK